MRQVATTLLLLMVLSLSMASRTSAQLEPTEQPPESSYVLTASSISSGGGVITGATSHHVLLSTLGQPLAGDSFVLTYQNAAGFIPQIVLNEHAPTQHRALLPIIVQ